MLSQNIFLPLTFFVFPRVVDGKEAIAFSFLSHEAIIRDLEEKKAIFGLFYFELRTYFGRAARFFPKHDLTLFLPDLSTCCPRFFFTKVLYTSIWVVYSSAGTSLYWFKLCIYYTYYFYQ